MTATTAGPGRPAGSVWRRAAVASLLAAAAGHAPAHDSWLAPQPPTERGEVVLALGTGDHFPRHDSPVPLDLLAASGCQDGTGAARPLRWLADRPDALVLRTTRAVPPGLQLHCWARLHPVDIQIDDATVPRYFQEVNASAEVRAHWAMLQARGVRWQERYTKQARVLLATANSTPGTALPAAGPGLDLAWAAPSVALRVGDALTLQVLRNGQPLAGQAVALRNDVSPLALWLRSDATGRVQLPALPLAGRWLAAAVWLQPEPGQPERWQSEFITLGFDVLPR